MSAMTTDDELQDQHLCLKETRVDAVSLKHCWCCEKGCDEIYLIQIG